MERYYEEHQVESNVAGTEIKHDLSLRGSLGRVEARSVILRAQSGCENCPGRLCSTCAY